MKRLAPRVGLVAPLVAIIFSAALGALALQRYAAERHRATATAFVTHLAQWYAEQGPAGTGALARDARMRFAAIAARTQAGGYPYLHDLHFTAHTVDVRTGEALWPILEDDQAVALAVTRPGVTHLPSGAWRAAVRAPASDGEQSVAVVETQPLSPIGVPWWGLAASCLAAFALWFDIVRRSPGRGASPLVAAALSAGALLTPLGMRLLAVDAAEVGTTLGSADLRGAALMLAAAVAAPLTLVGVLAARGGSGPSPHRWAYAYIAPAMVGLGVLVVVPFVFGVVMSFHERAGGAWAWVGLSHYVDILTSTGRRLWEPMSFYFTLAVTALWTLVNVALHASIGLALALLLARPTLRFKAVYRVLLIVPWAVPSYITALVWKGMFNQQYGLVNHLLGVLGLAPVSWFASFWTAFAANVTTNTWLGFPFMLVVSLGALQSIPADLYEAAEVDGATRWQQFRHITLPLLRPALVPALLLGSVWTFNMFNVIYLVSGGQPGHATDILVTEAYRLAFEQDRYGYAAAWSVLIFVVLLAWGFLTRRAGEDDEPSPAAGGGAH